MNTEQEIPLETVIAEFEGAIQAVPEGPADEMLRDVMRRMVEVAQRHAAFLEAIATDPGRSSALTTFSTRLLLPSSQLLNRIKATGELRPISDLIIARALLSFFLGIVVSERAMPTVARAAMRMFPQRAWIDGMVDVLIYGLLEDNAR